MTTRFTIYCHTNRINGKGYVGQTKATVEVRWAEHVRGARRDRGCRLFRAAVRKYGPDAFDHEVLEVVYEQDAANAAEKRWIAERNTLSPNGYNLSPGGNVCPVGSDTRKLLSDAAKRREASLTAEQKSVRVRAGTTHAQRSEIRKQAWARRTPEQREQHRRAVSESLLASEKNRSAIQARWDAMGPEQRSEFSKRVHESQTPEQRSERQKKAWQSLTPEQKASSLAAMKAGHRRWLEQRQRGG